MCNVNCVFVSMKEERREMERVAEVATSWPTLGFTVLLAFFLVWWVLSLAVSGLDGTDLDADGDGISDDLFGKVGHFVGIGSVPLALGLTIFAAGSWSISMLLQLVLSERGSGITAVLVAAVIAFVATGLGLVFTRRVSKWCAPVFDFHPGPRRADAAGAKVKVRTLHVDETFGEAEVLTGPRANSIVRVRAKRGAFSRGDVAMIVDYNEGTDTFALVEIDDILRDD